MYIVYNRDVLGHHIIYQENQTKTEISEEAHSLFV